jgi:hypothetical protein
MPRWFPSEVFMRFTIRDLLWLTVVVAVALAIYFVRPRPERPQWEYRINHNIGHVDDYNAEGKEGWELVLTEEINPPNRRYIFKRLKSHN